MNTEKQKPLTALSRRSPRWRCCPVLLVLALVSFAAGSFGADTNSPAAMTGKPDETNIQDALRAYLQLQEQIHATQLTIERNRKEADAAAAENAKAFASRLQAIEQGLALQRTEELEAMQSFSKAMQSSNNVMFLVAAVFAAFGLLALLFMAYFQSRTISRLAEIAAVLPATRTVGGGPPVASLGVGDGHVVTVGPAEQSSQRLLGTLERLEKRICQLEHTSPPPIREGASLARSAPSPEAPSNGEVVASAAATRIAMLLGKGQSLLNLDQAEEALACFDQALALEPNHPEALVKKGAALERLRKPDEAIACYDQAIAADSSLTVAYLYKGGLFNRMERFGEALECYGQALRTQQSRRA